jgi:RNA polymerase sigma-70 factor (ECF subfamily)
MAQETAFLELLAANHGRWRAIARSYAAHDAEDLFQEILLQVWRSLRTFEGRSAVGTWCYRVALNTAMSWRRSEKTRRQRLPVRDGYDPATVPSRAKPDGPSDLLQRTFETLTPADRAVLLLFLDDVGYTEMGEILGASEGSLRVQVHRIKARLAELHRGETDEL